MVVDGSIDTQIVTRELCKLVYESFTTESGCGRVLTRCIPNELGVGFNEQM